SQFSFLSMVFPSRFGAERRQLFASRPAPCHVTRSARRGARPLPPQPQTRLTGQFPCAAEQAVKDQGPPDVPVQAVFRGEPDPAQHSGRTVTPGASMPARKAVIPPWPGAVRASRTQRAAYWARLVQTFCPLTTQSPTRGTARVASDARSLPAPGSEN